MSLAQGDYPVPWSGQLTRNFASRTAEVCFCLVWICTGALWDLGFSWCRQERRAIRSAGMPLKASLCCNSVYINSGWQRLGRHTGLWSSYPDVVSIDVRAEGVVLISWGKAHSAVRICKVQGDKEQVLSCLEERETQDYFHGETFTCICGHHSRCEWPWKTPC